MNNDSKKKIKDALKQRMFLIDYSSNDQSLYFKIENYSSKVYDITINSNKITCTCPDYNIRNRICRHILFILSRILKIEFLTDTVIILPVLNFSLDISDLGKKLNNKLNPRLHVYKDIVEGLPESTQECSICFEKFTEILKLTQCHYCKNFFHMECIRFWLRSAVRSGFEQS